MSKPDWGVVVTEIGGEPTHTTHFDDKLDERLSTLKSKWKNRNPDKEFSVVLKSGTLVYVGRYNEGVVISIQGDNDLFVPLTPEMAQKLAEALAE